MKVRGQVHNWHLHSPHLTYGGRAAFDSVLFFPRFHLQQNVVYLFTILSFFSFFFFSFGCSTARASPMHSLLIFAGLARHTHTHSLNDGLERFVFRVQNAHTHDRLHRNKKGNAHGHRAPAQNEFTYALHSSLA